VLHWLDKREFDAYVALRSRNRQTVQCRNATEHLPVRMRIYVLGNNDGKKAPLTYKRKASNEIYKQSEAIGMP